MAVTVGSLVANGEHPAGSTDKIPSQNMSLVAQARPTPVLEKPDTMRAAVYRGKNDIRLEEVPVPEIASGEVLVSRACLRHLRHGREEDYNRLALRSPNFWT